MTAKAIETFYAGCRFRSRLEARWAVFFDVLGIDWQYEPQGFLFDGGFADKDPTPYLPDFYLPRTRTWVEVKGDIRGANFDLLADAVDSWGNGLPGIADSWNTTAGLLLLGPVPDTRMHHPQHPILQHHKGGWVLTAAFMDDGLAIMHDFDCHFQSGCCNQYGETWTLLVEGVFNGQCNIYEPWPGSPHVRAAYRQARSARFEHGDTPQDRLDLKASHALWLRERE